METIWKSVTEKGFTFNVSNNGNIRTMPGVTSFKRTKNNKTQIGNFFYKARELSQCKASNGYMEVACRRDGVRKKFSVHRLVAFAFVPGHFANATVNHINGNKLDNRPENLEWVTLAKNTELQWETGLVNIRGENHPSAKLTAKQVRIIRKSLQLGLTCGEVAALCNMSQTLIELIKKGVRWNSVI